MTSINEILKKFRKHAMSCILRRIPYENQIIISSRIFPNSTPQVINAVLATKQTIGANNETRSI